MFLKLSDLLGVECAQLKFLVCQIIAIFSGSFLRKWLQPNQVSHKWRHFFEFAVGIIILYIGYGSYMIHLFFQAIPAYLMLVMLPLSIAQYGILIFSMIYLSGIHLQQLIMYQRLTVDITAPLMIQTQKLSSLAFNINDGVKLSRGVQLKESHRIHAIGSRPRLLQLGGYLFSFHNCMIGPFNFFADYLKFIEGRESERLSDPIEKENFEQNKDKIRAAKDEIWKQTKLAIFHALLTIWSLRSFKADYFMGEEFGKKNFLQKYIYLSIAGFAFRQKFYFAWTVSGLANLNAGFGFSGFDAKGQPEYRLATNIYFLPIELGTSSKEILDSWNTATTRWLRECIYDRAPKRYAVWIVFAVSAMWHGFHPGYYWAFVSAALLTVAGRISRKYMRPYFIGSPELHFIYNIITNLGAMFCLNYLAVAFILLKTDKVLYFWRQMRFMGHIGPLVLIILLPLICEKPGSM